MLGLRWHQGRIVVPDRASLRERILHEHHDVLWAGHRGIARTLELVARV
jgi:hypothetical protein